MDAPQLPDAEASATPAGEPPPGQASAFRRALDAQVEPPEPSKALVPTGTHDLTVPIDVDVLRALFNSGRPPIPNVPPNLLPGIPPMASPSETLAALPMPAAPPSPPSPSGPAVVVPSVSVPALRAPTTIAPATADGAGNEPVATDGAGSPPPPESSASPRHDGGRSKASRLSTAIGVSAALAAIAGTALVLLDTGHSSDPLAPTAMPTKAVSHGAAPQLSHPVVPKPSPSPSPSPSAVPSHSASPSASASPSHSAGASPTPSTIASFATIYWTNSADPRVADIQQRLDKLNYLRLTSNNQYADTNRTLSRDQSNWRPPPDAVGFYHYATDLALRVFKYDYIQHGQGRLPMPGCDTQTYQALVNATS